MIYADCPREVSTGLQIFVMELDRPQRRSQWSVEIRAGRDPRKNMQCRSVLQLSHQRYQLPS